MSPIAVWVHLYLISRHHRRLERVSRRLFVPREFLLIRGTVARPGSPVMAPWRTRPVSLASWLHRAAHSRQPVSAINLGLVMTPHAPLTRRANDLPHSRLVAPLSPSVMVCSQHPARFHHTPPAPVIGLIANLQGPRGVSWSSEHVLAETTPWAPERVGRETTKIFCC